MPTKTIHHLFLALALCVFAAGSVRMANRWYSSDYNQALEGYGLFGALRWAEGKSLYPTPSETPYYVYMVSPLHALVTGWFARAWDKENQHSRVMAIRALSLVALLLCAGWITAYARHTGLPWIAMITAAALGFYRVVDYATVGRNDLLSVLAEVSAAGCFFLWLRDSKRQWLAGFVLAAVASVFVRQTGIVAAGAAILALRVQRRDRTAAGLTAILVGLGVVVLGSAQWVTGGTFFAQVILSNLRPGGIGVAWQNLIASSTLVFGVLQVVFFALSFYGTRGIAWFSPSGYLRLCFMLAFALASALLLRPGGDSNYFLPAQAFAIPFCARAIVQLGVVRVFVPVTLSLLMLASVLTIKAWPSKPYAFARVSRELERLSKPIFVGGSLGDSLIVHMRDRAVHGPSLTNRPAPVAEVAGKHFLFVYDDLYDRVRRGEVRYAVFADPGCGDEQDLTHALEGPELRRALTGFEFSERLQEGFCLYRTNEKVENL